MLNAEQQQSFAQDGYLVVPGVLGAAQVQSIRDFLRPRFLPSTEKRYPGDSGNYLFNLWGHYPELRWLLFHSPALAVLRSLLGDDFVYLKESSAHLNGFGGWHKDTTSQEKAGETFHWQEDYLMVEAGYYLQDNTPEFGGGLDVQPGTHKKPDPFVKQKSMPDSFKKVRNWTIAKRNGVYSIPSKAGDLVIFDFRINHRATPRRQIANVPPDKEKIAVFQACSRNNAHAHAYHDYILHRPDYAFMKECAYPPDLLEQAKAAGVTLA